MTNRLVRKRQAMVAAGCVFCCAAVLIAFGNAAGMSVSLAATGDHVFLDSEWEWTGSNAGINNLPNLSCGQEVLSGNYAMKLLSQGATLSSKQSVDDTEIMVFQSGTDLTAGKSVLKEHTGLFSVDAGATSGNCQGGINSTTYNEMAGAGASFMGDGVKFTSKSAVIQASDEIPDSMAYAVKAEGSGWAAFDAYSFSQIGLGNTSAIILENKMNTHSIVGGKQFSGGMDFTWETFTKSFGGF
jgi:hypothetical protein